MDKRLAFISLLLGIVVLTIDLPISENQISGVYANNNFNEKPFYAEIPYIQDTLRLNLDKTFSSNYFQSGRYTIKSGLFDNELSLFYQYSDDIPKSILDHSNTNIKEETTTVKGNVIRTFNVQNKLFQGIQIELVKDLRYHYTKIQ